MERRQSQNKRASLSDSQFGQCEASRGPDPSGSRVASLPARTPTVRARGYMSHRANSPPSRLMGVLYKRAWLAQARRIISNFVTLAQTLTNDGNRDDSSSPPAIWRGCRHPFITLTKQRTTTTQASCSCPYRNTFLQHRRLQRSCAHHWKLSARSKASSYRQAL